MPPIARTLTPKKGKVGNTAVVHGDALAGNPLEVKFGQAAANAGNPGGDAENIKCDIPVKDPRDPDTVTVTVKVGGVEAQYPAGPLTFDYNIPQPAPTISDYKAGDGTKSVKQNAGFTLVLSGANFIIPGRVPQRCIAVGGDTETSLNIVGTATATQVTFYFPGLSVAGDYSLVVGFSDGSGASIAAPGFVTAVATAPQIDSFTTDPAPLFRFTGFTLVVVGRSFTDGRNPVSAAADGPSGDAIGSLIAGSVSNNGASFSFQPELGRGDYVVTVFFDDGKTAQASDPLTIG